MGYPYGDALYGSGLYSRRPDWWRDRACENEEWVPNTCEELPWVPVTPPQEVWTSAGQSSAAWAPVVPTAPDRPPWSGVNGR